MWVGVPWASMSAKLCTNSQAKFHSNLQKLESCGQVLVSTCVMAWPSQQGFLTRFACSWEGLLRLWRGFGIGAIKDAVQQVVPFESPTGHGVRCGLGDLD